MVGHLFVGHRFRITYARFQKASCIRRTPSLERGRSGFGKADVQHQASFSGHCGFFDHSDNLLRVRCLPRKLAEIASKPLCSIGSTASSAGTAIRHDINSAAWNASTNDRPRRRRIDARNGVEANADLARSASPSLQEPPLKTIISLVVDDQPKFLVQAWNLILSLKACGSFPAPGVRLLLHYTKQVDARRLTVFKALGAELVEIEPFGSGAALYCNKLRQLETPAVLEVDQVLLLDADVVVLSSLTSLLADNGAVRAKVVDAPKPREPVLRALFAAAGQTVDPSRWTAPSLFPSDLVPATNCNGGVYLIPGAAISVLASAWPRWARFCLEQKDILSNSLHNADQLGFCLAMEETGLPFRPLDIADNFPSHFPVSKYDDVAERPLRLVHYHSVMDNHGLPAAMGLPWVDRQVAHTTAAIRDLRRDTFDNEVFWDFRYRHFPELGSGVGSRGDPLTAKRVMLAPLLDHFAEAEVVDIGCGDLETLREAPLKYMTGVDLSAEALETARRKRPDWRFVQGRAADLADRSAALAICLDVLIHQKTQAEADDLIENIVRVASDAVVISGYEEPVNNTGIVFFRERLSERLAAHPDIERIVRLGGYRDITVLAALKRGATPIDLEQLVVAA